MKKVAVISTKGGVGKTTTAVNVAGIAADAGKRVLILDLDIQPTLSSYFTWNPKLMAAYFSSLASTRLAIAKSSLKPPYRTFMSSSQMMTKAN